ncbi:pirin family protein [Glaciecola sp. MH2013]|uniref:pirin family protein n=1 Tax=Glaciecola sp. MH2013 TaxID=2785524 RepID=UPI0018A0DA1A|nr:pirin family protein [Glaciecola sp. MH2013]MBF7072668.1 pirin family protein [Glaciecola sp. MH2013]
MTNVKASHSPTSSEKKYGVVTQIVQGMASSDGAGVKLKRVLGQPILKRLDPFLMLDEFGSEQAEDYLAGFPQHPHRGFQTVTYMLNGKMGHKDSVGNEGLIEDGGLQWMNAGKGIIHEEMPKQTEGKMRGFQLWVNLPSSEKMSEPGYHDIASANVPELMISDTAKIRILAGEFKGSPGAVKTQAVKPQFFDFHFDQEQSFELPTISSHNGFVYVYEGEINIEGKSVKKGQLAVIRFTDALLIKSAKATKLIFVSGEPINEPVVQYGPFVMNSQDEINQALKDYQMGVLA